MSRKTFKSDLLEFGQPINRRHPLNRGLLGRWRAWGNRFGFGSGQLRNLAATQHGTLANMVPSTDASGWGATSRFGGEGELRFDGSDDRVNLGQPAPLLFTGSVTLIWWENWGSSLGIGERSPISRASQTLTDWVVDRVGAGIYRFYIGSTFRLWATGEISGEWHQRAAVYNAAALTMDVYLDGKDNSSTMVGSVPASIPNNSLDTQIGRYGTAQYFKGLLDDLAIILRPLSAAEIRLWYEASRRPDDQTLNWVKRVICSFPQEAAGGAISGIAAMAFAGTSLLTGVGALAGSGALAFAAGSSALSGAGALLGSSAVVFGTGSSTLAGAGTLAGSSALTFGAGSSTLAGVGALAGSSGIVISATGSAAGAGALLGSAVVAFGAGSSLLAGAGALGGSAALLMSGAGQAAGAGALAGSAALVLSAAALAAGSGALAGSAAMVFTVSATPAGAAQGGGRAVAGWGFTPGAVAGASFVVVAAGGEAGGPGAVAGGPG